MLELAGPVNRELGRGRLEERAERRRERWREPRRELRQIKDSAWATVLAVVGEWIARWLSALVRLPSRLRGCWSDTRRDSWGNRVGTDGHVKPRRGGVNGGRVVSDGRGVTNRMCGVMDRTRGGGGWYRSSLRKAGSADRRANRRNAGVFLGVFFVGADDVSLHTAAEGVGVEADRQTLRNRELGQHCQLAMWLKRYKTGMFANLANLANVFSPNRPTVIAVTRPASPMSPNAQHSGLGIKTLRSDVRSLRVITPAACHNRASKRRRGGSRSVDGRRWTGVDYGLIHVDGYDGRNRP